VECCFPLFRCKELNVCERRKRNENPRIGGEKFPRLIDFPTIE
jgi:hypothetical protein